MAEKEIKINPKRVDESWKENVTGTHDKAPARAPEPAIGFSPFIQSITMQAYAQLGLVPPPGGEEPEVNLEAARELIDILVMLEAKTAGNLSAEEKKLLCAMMADLQLKFVSVSQGKNEKI